MKIGKYEPNNIYNLDVLEFLAGIPDDTIDCTVTSPPYNVGLGKPKGGNWDWAPYADYQDDMPEDDYQAWQIQVLTELWRVLKPTGSIWYNHKVRQRNRQIVSPLTWIERSPCPIRQEIVWVCGQGGNINSGYFHAADERIYWLAGQEVKFDDNMRGYSTVWTIPRDTSPGHPAVFPIALPARCIAATTHERDIVLDPFCGSGTTCLAAAQLGRYYLGCDISGQYVELAKERLAEWQSQPTLF